MARQVIAPQTIVGPYPDIPVSANDLDIAMIASDEPNGDEFAFTGSEIILLHNTEAGAQTVTFTSVELNGRLGTITDYSIGIGEYAAFKVDKLPGWKQTDGNFYINTSHVDVLIAILRFK